MRGCLSIIGLVILVLSGFALPKHFIDSGINEFEGKDRDRARFALWFAEQEQDETVGEIMITAYRVERVDKCNGPPASDPPDIKTSPTPQESKELARELPYPPDVGYVSFEVVIYSVFGIPFGKSSLGCDEPR